MVASNRLKTDPITAGNDISVYIAERNERLGNIPKPYTCQRLRLRQQILRQEVLCADTISELARYENALGRQLSAVQVQFTVGIPPG